MLARLSLTALLFTPTVIVLPHQVAVAQSAAQVANTAKQITVLIQGQNPGSGVIIRREGNTYTVLTARHVVATPDEYEIITPDGQKHRLNYSTVKPIPGVDLATLQFTSTNVYPVAKLGYALVYSNNTLPGMSGGSVLNAAGEVIGIHGKGDTDTTSARATANPDVVLKTGFNLAIPINTFLTLAGRTGVTGFTAPAVVAASDQPTADDLYLQAMNKLRNLDYRGAIADFDRVIRINPQYADAYVGRGNARADLGDKQGAIADYNEAIRLNPQYAIAFHNRGNVRSALGDKQGAIQDYNEAIRINPQYADAYVNRGVARSDLGDRQGAIADYTEAIRLNPQNAIAFYNRGNPRSALGDKQGALADYSEAIRLNPQFANAYVGRGNARFALGDKQGAIADYNEAIRLNPQFANAYAGRGLARSDLGDRQGAIQDYNEAIRIKPQEAFAYVGRGLARYGLGDRQGAILDYQKAADLARAQGNQRLYELATKALRRLQQ
jgi:tetratricopeptide (TPR) repeat protein